MKKLLNDNYTSIKISLVSKLFVLGLFSVALFSIMIFSLSCKTTQKVSKEECEELINHVTNYAEEIHKTSPNLPGFQNIETIKKNVLSERSSIDVQLILGRLYYDIINKMQSNLNDSKIEKEKSILNNEVLNKRVSELLNEPIPLEKYGKDYFTKLLQDTKETISNNLEFKNEVNLYAQRILVPGTTPCFVDGNEFPLATCRFLSILALLNSLSTR